jgi:hypothetical protein
MIFGGGSVWLQKRAMTGRKGEKFPPHLFSLTESPFSSWLHKTRNGSNRHTRVVWSTAILILVLIAGGVVLGVFLRRNAPASQQPTALGGSADNSLATSTSSVVNTMTGLGQPSQTSLHVSPTLTLANRGPEPSPSAVF